VCGLTGFWQPGGFSADSAKAVAEAMACQITHRGPDDAGVWLDETAGLALAHRRLSILDLSPAGHQPMISACGRYVIVFNGEIYNHLELRAMIEKPTWCGHSDTETLLATIAECGVEATLKHCVGMFAFVLWDRETSTLTLARDRLGEKPLYYGWQNDTFMFGSELKALRAHPTFRGHINRSALTLFLRHNYIPSPYSIFQGIHKLLPGAVLTLRSGEREPTLVAYWSVANVSLAGQRDLFHGCETEAQDELDRLMRQSISGQMIADVPLGAFLSGGIDSSTVVALMQAQSIRPVKTYTIGFYEASYNEAEQAQAVAAHLKTEHTELYVAAEQAMAVIPRLPTLYDEPFADSSQIPTFLVSELASRHVKVSLSGDGGDELFGGYNRYFWAINIWRRIGLIPQPLRSALAGVITSLPPVTWNGAFRGLLSFLPAGWRHANLGDKLHKMAEILAVRSPEEIYLGLVSHWKQPKDVVIGGSELPTVITDQIQGDRLSDLESRMMYLDQVTYLPGDILVKVDRAAMGVSLETRVPFLDHRVVEFAWRLPLHLKIREGQGKWILRQVVNRYVPKALIERPKMGFGVPIDAWLRGPLKDWAEALLDGSRLRREGFFNPAPIREKWVEHLTGRRNWAYYLWDILMFQAWHETVQRH
jgi:asparagine synthase (glutamine-hydrolysing)